MKKIIVLIAILLIGYLSLGVEYIYKDYTDRYDPFIKKYPTTRFYFSNPVVCGECDFREYSSFNIEEPKKRFKDLCYYRYGLEDISQCEDLFRH